MENKKDSVKKPILFMSASTGWAVRNFFQTGIVRKLNDDFKIVVFTTSQIREGLVGQGYGGDLTFIVLDKFSEPLAWRLSRQLKRRFIWKAGEARLRQFGKNIQKGRFIKKLAVK